MTFEGIDGSGKTTQLRLLEAHLRERLVGRSVVMIHEPGGTTIGERIRDVLLDPLHEEMSVETEVLLYFASRAQLVSEIVRPAIERGDLVLSDRYYDATLAYQGYGRGVSSTTLDHIQAFAAGGMMPDLTILLDLDPAEGRRRIAGGRGGVDSADRMERQRIEFAERVRDGYLSIAAAEPERFRVIDAARDVESIAADVRAAVDAYGI